MAPLRSDLQQGYEHESTPMQFRMRQDKATRLADQTGATHDTATKIENVDIQRPRPPPTIRAATGPPLQPFQQRQQQPRRDGSADADHRIHERGLTHPS